MKNSILLWSVGGAAVLVAIIGSAFLFRNETCRDFNEGRVEIGGTQLSVSVAQTPSEFTAGLIGCRELPENTGMYFPYDPPNSLGFWMKGMLMPLDIVWISNGKVVGVEENVPPVEKTAVDPTVYDPPIPVSAVLEVGPGKAKEYGLVVGTTVNYVPK